MRCLEQRRAESLSAVELAEELRRLGRAVGLSTIYRQLEKLAAVGQIHRIDTAEGAPFISYAATPAAATGTAFCSNAAAAAASAI